MYIQSILYSYDIDFSSDEAKFIFDRSTNEDLFIVINVELEQYDDYENPICVIKDILGCWMADDASETILEEIEVFDSDIDTINNTLTTEYVKYLNNN